MLAAPELECFYLLAALHSAFACHAGHFICICIPRSQHHQNCCALFRFQLRFVISPQFCQPDAFVSDLWLQLYFNIEIQLVTSGSQS